jgi:quinoprotein glucose dehydrogenase
VAIDPERGIAIVSVNRLAAMVQLLSREDFDPAKARAAEQRLGDDFEYNPMRGTPYVMRRRLLLAPSKMPCTPPPFGSLVAIDLKSGGRLWEVPLGSLAALNPAATLPAE